MIPPPHNGIINFKGEEGSVQTLVVFPNKHIVKTTELFVKSEGIR